MKKLLIIQQDDAYFLFETLQTIDRQYSSLKDFEVTILANPEAVTKVQEGFASIFKNLTVDESAVLKQSYDISFNFSLNEKSWAFHSNVKSVHKIGPWIKDDLKVIQDAWSAYYLTIKSKAPFLCFHLDDIYKNILGIKRIKSSTKHDHPIRTIAFGTTAPHLFAPDEQESFIEGLSKTFNYLNFLDISEIDTEADLSSVLYVGPCTLDALKVCQAGGRGIFLGSHFQGFNLLPIDEGNLYVSSRGKQLTSKHMQSFVSNYLNRNSLPAGFPYSVYRVEDEHLFGAYLKSLNESDDNYPFYQSHVVLWNFILNLFDTNLEIIHCSPSQTKLLEQNKVVLNKLIRLYDYAMSSIDTLHDEAKSGQSHADKIQGHLKNLQEIDHISDQISQTHPMLRPVLDFYRIRRGQNDGNTLLEMVQHSFLTYSEEHQALKALEELFSVTLRKNEVSI